MGGSMSLDCTSRGKEEEPPPKPWALPALPWAKQSGDGGGIFASPINEDATLMDIANALDLDKLRASWEKYAGPDDNMDYKEYTAWIKAIGLPESYIDQLWVIMDRNSDGAVDVGEFQGALDMMTSRRAFLRYCPTCLYERSCEYCISIADSNKSTEYLFCPEHWAQHPGRVLGPTADQ